MLTAGHATLTRDSGLLGSFFDAQGHALLHGHLAVSPSQASFEGFDVGGHTYLYFGPVPAVLRLPVLLFTHSLDGRLTELSMLAAFVVLLGAGGVLHWRVRRLVRPEAPIGRADSAAAFLLQLALGAGAVPLFLASWAVVYHEVELWGAALAIAATAAVLGVIARPSMGRIAGAGALAALAVNTRVSVGLAPILALCVLSAGCAAAAVQPRLERRGRRRAGGLAGAVATLGPPGAARGRVLAALLAAALVPLALSAAVNQAKFGRPFGIPIDKQVDTRIDPPRRAVLAANGGHYFGVRFVPSTLLAAARPDAVGSLRAFPFIGLPTDTPTAVGDVTLDRPPQSPRAPTPMPLLSPLPLVRLVALARRRDLRPLLGVLVATAGGFAATLTIATYFTRYLADALPFLLLGGLAGLQALAAIGRGARRLTIVARGDASGRVVLALRVGGRTVATGRAVRVPTGGPASVVVSFDDLNGASFASVRVNGRDAVLAPAPY